MDWIIALLSIDPQAIWIAAISGVAMILAGASATILGMRSRTRQDGVTQLATVGQLNTLAISNAMELLAAEKARADRAEARADKSMATVDKLQQDLDELREEMRASGIIRDEKIAAQQAVIADQQNKIATLEYQLAHTTVTVTVSNPKPEEEVPA